MLPHLVGICVIKHASVFKVRACALLFGKKCSDEF